MDIGEERPLFSGEEVKNVTVEWLVFYKDKDGSIKLIHEYKNKLEAFRLAKYESEKHGGYYYVMPATAVCMNCCSS